MTLKIGDKLPASFVKVGKALRLGARALRRRCIAMSQDQVSDSRVILSPQGGDFPVGWCLLEVALGAANSSTVDMSLLVDYGDAGNDLELLRLPPAIDGTSTEVLHLNRGLRQLTLEARSATGEFSLRQVSVTEITKSEAQARFAARFAKTRRWEKRDAMRLAKKAIKVWRRDGLGRVLELIRGNGRAAIDSRAYGDWIERFDRITDTDRSRIAQRIAAMDTPPLISVVMPVYNAPAEFLRKAIESVRSQLYPHWELCIADDASPNADTRNVLVEYQRSDPRIKVVFRSENGHISRASNSALELAVGELVALLDHDDELAPHALYMVAETYADNREAHLFYSDEDKIDAAGKRYDPYFKSDWNLELFRGQNFISHLGVYRRKLLHQLGGFRTGFEGSQDYDLALRVVECLKPEQIVHIPWVLYHWRSLPGSTALDVGEKSYAFEAAGRALREHLQRTNVDATVEKMQNGIAYHRVRYKSLKPRVAIIIPTKDRIDLLARAVDSILEKTEYPDYEIVIVDNRSEQDETRAYLASLAGRGLARVLPYDHPFNYSAINNFAVAQCTAPIVALLNNDVEVINSDWLTELVSHAARSDVGCVGAMLYYPDDRIQHAGVVTGVHGIAGHIYRMMQRGSPGYFGRALLTQDMSVVTAACLVVRREVYQEVGGLDEQLKVAFNDVDFCLRVRGKGYRNVWAPGAELYHHESATRGQDTDPRHRARFASEIAFMRQRWGGTLAHDPTYNPNLSLASLTFELAPQPRTTRPWYMPARATRQATATTSQSKKPHV